MIDSKLSEKTTLMSTYVGSATQGTISERELI